MDTTIYGFSHNPFATSPGPRSVFAHDEYRRARGALEYALMDGTGMVVIAGESGTGKHTLVQDLLSRYPLNDLEVGQCSANDTSQGGLLGQVASAFGLALATQDDEHATSALQQFLEEKQTQNKKTLLVIHDADRLDIESLEKLRAFISIDGHTASALHIYLVGHPDIQKLINDFTDKHPLGDAVTHIRLGPMLMAEETRAYIAHHLDKAGGDGRPELDDDAVSLLHSCSGGVPGKLNLICFQLLENGSRAGKNQLDSGDVEKAAKQANCDDTISTSGTGVEQVAASGEGENTAATELRPPPAPRRRKRRRKTPRRAAEIALDDAANTVNTRAGTASQATDTRVEPVFDSAPPQDVPEIAAPAQAPDQQGTRWGGMLLVVLFIVLVLGAGAYWDLSNARRLMQIEPVAQVLQSLGIASLFPAAGEQPLATQTDTQPPESQLRAAITSPATDMDETYTEAEETFDIDETYTEAEETFDIDETYTEADETFSEGATDPGQASSFAEPDQDTFPANSIDEMDPPSASAEASMTVNETVPTPSPAITEFPVGGTTADLAEAAPGVEVQIAEEPIALDGADVVSPASDEVITPAGNTTGQTALNTDAAVEAEVPAEVPAGPRMALLLPSGPDQRYIDLALTNRGRGLIISPELGRALQPYADRLLWQRDGTLKVIPKGLNTLTSDYDPLILQESVDNIAFVVRNFRGVGLLIRQAVDDEEPFGSTQEAVELVESRLRNREFAPREVSLVRAITASTTSADESAPLYLLVVPHR